MKATVIGFITLGKIEVPPKWVINIAFEKGIELASTCSEVHILIESYYIWDILGETNMRICKWLDATVYLGLLFRVRIKSLIVRKLLLIM